MTREELDQLRRGSPVVAIVGGEEHLGRVAWVSGKRATVICYERLQDRQGAGRNEVLRARRFVAMKRLHVPTDDDISVLIQLERAHLMQFATDKDRPLPLEAILPDPPGQLRHDPRFQPLTATS